MTALERGKALYKKGRLREAVVEYQQAFKDEPENPECWYRAGLALIGMRDYKGACDFLEAAIYFDSDSVAAWYNLGIAYEASGQDEKAEMCYTKVLKMSPDAIVPMVNLGGVLYRQGKHEEAYNWHSESLKRFTKNADDLGQRAFVKMLRGDYIGGFRDYEGRWKSAQVKADNWIPPFGKRWNGQRLSKKQSLLLYSEQGLGDTLMMLRYLPMMKERADNLTVIVHEAIASLVRHSFPEYNIITQGHSFEATKYHVPTMSLPGVFGTTVNSIPWNGAYLKNPHGLDVSGMVKSSKPLVGVCLSGNRHHMNDHDRSMPEEYRESFLCSDVDWVELDKDRSYFDIKDMGDTADVIQACDLVVTVDTSVAHLAGAMGKPTWIMVPSSPEWRWGLASHTTPWYPTATLFRRKHTKDWTSVITEIHEGLNTLARRAA